MKPGDMVILRADRVAVQLLSDSIENSTKVRSVTYGKLGDSTSFRRGDTGTVVEVNTENTSRVKILYRSAMWWGNVSDLLVIS